MRVKLAWRWTWVVSAVVACSSTQVNRDGGSDGGSDAGVALYGSVQKGPFIHGSSVTIQELNSSLQPSGQSFNIQTTDDLGSFNIPPTVAPADVEVIANGYYYDEIIGNLSSSQLTLRCITDISSSTLVNVNILTTLAEQRIRQLVAGGSTFTAARAEAEPEVLALLGIQATATTTFDQMDISQSGLSNAILLAASVLLEQAAYITNPTSPVAGLSELIATLSSELTVGDAGIDPVDGQVLCNARTALNPAAIKTNLGSRYASLGVDASVPDFADLVMPDPCGCGVGASSDAGLDGGATILASGLADPIWVVLDSSNVYWTAFQLGDAGPQMDDAGNQIALIMKVSKAGRCMQTLASQPVALIGYMTVDSSHVYWTGSANERVTTGVVTTSTSVTWVGSDGGTPVTLVPPVQCINAADAGYCPVTPGGIAVDNTNVYWASGEPGVAPFGQVLSVPIGGGSVNVLATGQDYPDMVALQGANVYWNNRTEYSVNGTIQDVPTDASAPDSADGSTTVVPPQTIPPLAFALDSTTVYWTGFDSSDHGGVWKAPLTGGDGGVSALVANELCPSSIAVDNAFVYYATLACSGTASLRKVPISGGSPVTLASSPHNISGVAVDSSNIYWLEQGVPSQSQGVLLTMPK